MVRNLTFDARVHLAVLALVLGVAWQSRDRIWPGPESSRRMDDWRFEQLAMHYRRCTRTPCPLCAEARPEFRARAEAEAAPQTREVASTSSRSYAVAQ